MSVHLSNFVFFETFCNESTLWDHERERMKIVQNRWILMHQFNIFIHKVSIPYYTISIWYSFYGRFAVQRPWISDTVLNFLQNLWKIILPRFKRAIEYCINWFLLIIIFNVFYPCFILIFFFNSFSLLLLWSRRKSIFLSTNKNRSNIFLKFRSHASFDNNLVVDVNRRWKNTYHQRKRWRTQKHERLYEEVEFLKTQKILHQFEKCFLVFALVLNHHLSSFRMQMYSTFILNWLKTCCFESIFWIDLIIHVGDRFHFQ